MISQMAGTQTPEQMQMKALIESLRQPAQQLQPMAPQQNQAVSANPESSDMAPVLGQLGGLVNSGLQNIGTAFQYGASPFSQQTNMLAAQDAAFRKG